MLETIFIILGTSLLTCFIVALYVRKTLPNILEEVAVEAGAQISEHLKETFADPNVKKAFTILGKQSGTVRASDALRNKVSSKILDGIPSIGFLLDQLGVTPTEGLQLWNDPVVGPFIQNIMKKGIGGLMSGQSKQSVGVSTFKSKF